MLSTMRMLGSCLRVLGPIVARGQSLGAGTRAALSRIV